MRINAVSLQGLTDLVPLAREHGASIFAASPMLMGFLGSRFDEYVSQRPLVHGLPESFAERGLRLRELAEKAGMTLSRLAVRFLLSMPAADFVIVGASRPQTWADCRAAYEAGPLDADLYADVWRNAQRGPEFVCGG